MTLNLMTIDKITLGIMTSGFKRSIKMTLIKMTLMIPKLVKWHQDMRHHNIVLNGTLQNDSQAQWHFEEWRSSEWQGWFYSPLQINVILKHTEWHIAKWRSEKCHSAHFHRMMIDIMTLRILAFWWNDNHQVDTWLNVIRPNDNLQNDTRHNEFML